MLSGQNGSNSDEKILTWWPSSVEISTVWPLCSISFKARCTGWIPERERLQSTWGPRRQWARQACHPPAQHPTCSKSCSVDHFGLDPSTWPGRRWKDRKCSFLFLPFPSKIMENVARVQVDSGTLSWKILIRQQGQEGNLLTRLGLVRRLPQVSPVHRERRQEVERRK